MSYIKVTQMSRAQRQHSRMTYYYWRRTYIHTYIHTYINTYINTYIHTYINTYTSKQLKLPELSVIDSLKPENISSALESDFADNFLTLWVPFSTTTKPLNASVEPVILLSVSLLG